MPEQAEVAPMPDGVADPAAVGFVPRAGEDLATALRRFREEVILHDLPGSEPERCILREEMIRAIVVTRPSDEDEWFAKVPERLRSRTDPRQKRYWAEICEIVARFG